MLLGLPGAGKSTVGPLVAARLGWRFVDLDDVISAEAGFSITEIFAREGEPGFRAREARATGAIAAEALVLAPGGGWIEDPSNMRALGVGTLSVYLRVSVMVALSRMGESAGTRPLIAGARSADQLRELLRRREALYLQANHTVNVDSMTPVAVGDSIVALASHRSAD